MEVRDERTRFARNLDVHSIALHVSDDEQDELELDHVMLGGYKTRFNHQSRHNGAQRVMKAYLKVVIQRRDWWFHNLIL
jgi:hypothetical protein